MDDIRPTEASTWDAGAPPYLRVKHHVLTHILAGDWAVGDRIPSEHDLKAQFGVARMTVNRAIRELTDEGYVSRAVGAGTYVSDRRAVGAAIPLRDITEEARAAGKSLRVRVVSSLRTRANGSTAARLRIARNELVFCTILVRWMGNTPIQLEERWVNARLAPSFENLDFEGKSVDEQLMRLSSEVHSTHEVSAVVPLGRERTLLALAHGEACLRLTSTLMAGDETLSVADLYMPGSRYVLPGRFL